MSLDFFDVPHFNSCYPVHLQANSPIRTLDELNVMEVVSSPCFPALADRRQEDLQNGDPCISSENLETEVTGHRVESTTKLTDLGFGIRRKHQCFVVTARARSFLYHQV